MQYNVLREYYNKEKRRLEYAEVAYGLTFEDAEIMVEQMNCLDDDQYTAIPQYINGG